LVHQLLPGERITENVATNHISPKVWTVVPEQIDLADLRKRLADHFGVVRPAGYVEGKGEMRAAVTSILKCSDLEAERLVDTLEARGLIRYDGDPAHEVDRLERHWQLG
jgi:hypothetical protein